MKGIIFWWYEQTSRVIEHRTFVSVIYFTNGIGTSTIFQPVRVDSNSCERFPKRAVSN